VQHELNAPDLGRYCRLQIMAFLVLNLLGSCVHVPPGHGAVPVVKPAPSNLQVATPAKAVRKTTAATPATP